MLRDQGVLIKAKNYLLNSHPDLFKTKGEVHQWLMRLQNNLQGYEPYINTIYSVCTPQDYKFRLTTQRGGSMAKAASWLDDDGTHGTIQLLTGGAIAKFEPLCRQPGEGD